MSGQSFSISGSASLRYFNISTHTHLWLWLILIVDISGILSSRYFLRTMLNFITLFVRVLFSPTLLVPSTHLLLKNMQEDSWCLYRNCMESFTPSSVERYGATDLQVWHSMQPRSVMRRLSYLLLLTISLFRQQVFVMVSHSVWRFSRFFMTTLIHWILTIPKVIIKIDISIVFNTTCRTLTLDVLSGRSSRDYACNLQKGDGQVHLAKGKTGGQQGDPLEMFKVVCFIATQNQCGPI